MKGESQSAGTTTMSNTYTYVAYVTYGRAGKFCMTYEA